MGSGASKSSNLRRFLDALDGSERVDVLKNVLTDSGAEGCAVLEALACFERWLQGQCWGLAGQSSTFWA